MSRPTVLLADDHTIVIEGLYRVLESEFEIVGAVEDGRALIVAAEKLKPDVIVTDIAMPLLNGIEAARQILKADPKAKIIFLSMHPEVEYATEALDTGGFGYVLKSSAGLLLVTAIREALRGRVLVAPSIAAAAVQARVGKPPQRKQALKELTSRQREVLQLIAEGRTVKEIGEILHVSARTVEFHKYRIAEALGLQTTAELIQYATRRGIV